MSSHLASRGRTWVLMMGVSAFGVAACTSSGSSSGTAGAGAGASTGAAGSAVTGTGAGGNAGASTAAAGSAGTGGIAGTGTGTGGGTAGTGGGGGTAGTSAFGSSGAGGSSSGAGGASGGSTNGASGAGGGAATTFFVTSDTSKTGNLGGLTGADARCQALAMAAGFGAHTFHAYLSVEHDVSNANGPRNARDRIGAGPWFNALGALLARDVTALHALSGNANLFVDEKGRKINGQYAGSATPLEHDILTGSNSAGMLIAGQTCADWTSNSATMTAEVGHSDGLGPGPSSDPPYNSWNAAHVNGSCADTGPKGGAGRLYCFAIN